MNRSSMVPLVALEHRTSYDLSPDGHLVRMGQGRRRRMSQPMTAFDLRVLLEASDEATPGPWTVGERENAVGACYSLESRALQPDGVNVYHTRLYFSSRADARLHYLARKYLPLLLRDILRAKRIVRESRKPSMGRSI